MGTLREILSAQSIFVVARASILCRYVPLLCFCRCERWHTCGTRKHSASRSLQSADLIANAGTLARALADGLAESGGTCSELEDIQQAEDMQARALGWHTPWCADCCGVVNDVNGRITWGPCAIVLSSPPQFQYTGLLLFLLLSFDCMPRAEICLNMQFFLKVALLVCCCWPVLLACKGPVRRNGLSVCRLRSDWSHPVTCPVRPSS